MVRIHEKVIIIIDYHNGVPVIAIDRKECFDKVSKCPILVRCPKTEEEVIELDEKITWLETKEGLKASKSYDFSKWMKRYKGEEE